MCINLRYAPQFHYSISQIFNDKEASADGLLGSSAKVASALGAKDSRSINGEHVICVYSYDFTDLEDVARIAKNIYDLGAMPNKGMRYKLDTDAGKYVAFGDKAQNQYVLRASDFQKGDLVKNLKNQREAQQKLL